MLYREFNVEKSQSATISSNILERVFLVKFSSVQFIGISAYVHAFGRQSINSKKTNDGQGN